MGGCLEKGEQGKGGGGEREEGKEGVEANLALDHLLGNFDGGFTEGSSVLGTNFCSHSKERRIITVGLGDGWEMREREGEGRG